MTQVNSQFGKVAVLLGGNSAERDVSLKSGQAVLNVLLEVGIDAIAFDPQNRSLWELKSLKVDRVFIALHGRGGEDGTVQGALEFMNLPYTGSNVLGSALAMDKIRCKHLFKSAGLSTAPYAVVDAKKGFDAKLGARPLQRIIDDEIKNPLSKMILFGELSEGGRVEVTLTKDNKLAVDFKNKQVLDQFKPKVEDEKTSQ